MARHAAVDVGTNSLLLTIAEAGEQGLRVLLDRSDIVRLGEGADRAGALSEAAMARALATLREYATLCREHGIGPDEVAAAGTAALRRAANAADFLERAETEAGLRIEVVSGEREAALAFLAVQRDDRLGLPPGRLAVVDIGGGSTELIVGDSDGPLAGLSGSAEVGAVRVTERFFADSDPPTAEQVAAASDFIDDALAALPAPAPPVSAAGIGGTLVNMGAIELGLTEHDPERIHGLRLALGDVERQVTLLGSRTVEERRAIPGVEAKRADVLFAGALILYRLFRAFGVSWIAVSTRGLRYGLLHERAGAG